MMLKFAVTNLRARFAEAFRIKWEGKEFDPGPVNIELDRTAGTDNQGSLDYSDRHAEVVFHVLITFPEFANTLETLGVDAELSQPVRAVIHSKGDILDDHSFVLSGPCELAPHALLNAEETRASVLAGT